MNCWEFKNCPSSTHERCPAFPSRGLDCWKVTGTKCEQGKIEKASMLEKVQHCRACSFYAEFANKF